MADRIVTTTTTSYGQRIGGSLGGALIGLILFIASFAVLYWNEGRTDLSTVADDAVEISAEVPAPEQDNNFVYLTGQFVADQALGDDYLQPGYYIALERNVEMYAWEEEKTTETSTSTGGTQTTQTIYDYDKDWTDSPQDSSGFEEEVGHENPPMKIDSAEKFASPVNVGLYQIDLEQAQLPAFSEVKLTGENIVLQEGQKFEGGYIYDGSGNMTTPEVGDLRISYSALNDAMKGTAFAKLTGSQLVPYTDPEGNTIFRVFEGTRDQALETLHGEHVTSTWIFRALGFVMMWVGLALMLGPISTVLSFLPFLGNASGIVIGLITFIVAAVLSILTIIISMAAHNIYAIIIIGAVILIAIGLVITALVKRKH